MSFTKSIASILLAISRYNWRTSPPRPTIGDYLDSIENRNISDWNIYTVKNEIAVDYIGH